MKNVLKFIIKHKPTGEIHIIYADESKGIFSDWGFSSATHIDAQTGKITYNYKKPYFDYHLFEYDYIQEVDDNHIIALDETTETFYPSIYYEFISLSVVKASFVKRG